MFHNVGHSTTLLDESFLFIRFCVSFLAIDQALWNVTKLFEMLFHVMFKPYNSFCLYIDAKASEEFKSVIHSIINCYQVIFPKTFIVLAPITSHINWGGYSLINADLTCLDKLHFSNR